MSWDMLPSDIHIYILKIRNNIRNDASNIIQKYWRKYYKTIVSDLFCFDSISLEEWKNDIELYGNIIPLSS